MNRTKAQNAEIHRLLGLLAIEGEDKKALVFGFTECRSDSSKDLTKDEAAALISYLKDEDKRLHGKSRKLARHLLRLLGWSWDRIENYVRHIGANNPSRKALNNLGGKELNKVVTQIKILYAKETEKHA